MTERSRPISASKRLRHPGLVSLPANDRLLTRQAARAGRIDRDQRLAQQRLDGACQATVSAQASAAVGVCPRAGAREIIDWLSNDLAARPLRPPSSRTLALNATARQGRPRER